MLDIIIGNYIKFNDDELKKFFRIRKKIFKDELNWLVKCKKGMEFDDFDNNNAFYLIGEFKNEVVCGCRFIDMKKRNMCTDVFYKYFDSIVIKEGNYIELTRLFTDKEKIKNFGLKKTIINLILFIEILKFSSKLGYEGIYAVASEQLLNCLITSGWDIKIQKRGKSEKNEYIYLIIMPTLACNLSSLEHELKKETTAINYKLEYKVSNR
ncbi:hypothetical protein BTJ39_21075 [Izhakiella australiensis]|uniref:Acyl-homoserine-lactone synthase n=1 Tax=Izhakiella australiensis TaxID=1926881 RepID=A0A1S8YDV7_9GAMM|nr:acyl-homoserine-lactone synthase [Izhakiella australiensis]OON36976.1 hypothetical protein BTJ39_21075 [Izhakiella australiensis]